MYIYIYLFLNVSVNTLNHVTLCLLQMVGLHHGFPGSTRELHILGPEQVGEVCIKGPSVARGPLPILV